MTPKQDHPRNTTSLIKGLAGDHTIILSTHILSEVEQTCQQVIIIARGKLVATDSVENLTSRLRGAESVAVEVMPRDGAPLTAEQVQRRLEQVSGVNRVVARESRDGRLSFTVESQQGQHVRPELARAVVEAGWNLNGDHHCTPKVRAEGITIELTGAPKEDIAAAHATMQVPAGEIQ